MTEHSPSRLTPGQSVENGRAEDVARHLPEETPVALVYQVTTQAVMMATPADLDDFAVGFSLSEGNVDAVSEIESLEILLHDGGIEARMWLSAAKAERFQARRRSMLGPVGCGLCGIDSLGAALRDLPAVSSNLSFEDVDIAAAVTALRDHQPLHDQTRAVHAAGFWRPGTGLVAVREDVGRHNALDKLIGALARSDEDGGSGAVILTSRVSVEMVQKTAMLGAAVIVAVSAPTAQALRVAAAANIAVVANARGERFDVFLPDGSDAEKGNSNVT